VTATEEINRYAVRVLDGGQGWLVEIIDPGGDVVWSRACADEPEARTFASTVQQHIYWLSEEKFRGYYRLTAGAVAADPAGTG
jgi:hypothetical protein